LNKEGKGGGRGTTRHGVTKKKKHAQDSRGKNLGVCGVVLPKEKKGERRCQDAGMGQQDGRLAGRRGEACVPWACVVNLDHKKVRKSKKPANGKGGQTNASKQAAEPKGRTTGQLPRRCPEKRGDK